jgi:histidyl-tRNA synthetase
VVSQGQKGEIYSDYEFGLEVFGGFNHLTEAQVLSGVWQLLASLGLEQVSLEINTIGQAECQNAYEDVLRDFLKSKKFELCDNCNEHLTGRALNVFRCENLSCQAITAEAPTILDFLDEASHAHFTNILEALDELQIPYQLNPYYAGPAGTSRTNVVIKYKDDKHSFVIGEAGYHEGLMANVAGKNHCCFGFSGSLSKIQRAMESAGITVDQEHKSEVFLVPLGELAAKKSLRLFRDLTAAHVTVYDHFGNAGIKNQLKQAQTFNSPIALIMGQKEAMDEMVILRDVKSGMQEVFSYDKIVEEVKKRLGR